MPRNPRNPGQVRGERHGAAKLDERAVVALRRRARGATSLDVGFVSAAAARHGVAKSAISNAIHGITWGHVAGAVKRRLPASTRKRR